MTRSDDHTEHRREKTCDTKAARSQESVPEESNFLYSSGDTNTPNRDLCIRGPFSCRKCVKFCKNVSMHWRVNCVVESADSCTSETCLEQYFRAGLMLSTLTLKFSEPTKSIS